jgi:hypothetical protein
MPEMDGQTEGRSEANRPSYQLIRRAKYDHYILRLVFNAGNGDTAYLVDAINHADTQ